MIGDMLGRLARPLSDTALDDTVTEKMCELVRRSGYHFTIPILPRSSAIATATMRIEPLTT